MSRPPASLGPTARLVFESGGYRYSVLRHLVTHPHYNTLLLASRQHADGGPVKLVELKPVVLDEGREGLERVLEEVRLARFLRHPNIATVYGYAVQNELPHIVMEHLRGCYLLTVMDAAVAVGRRLSPAFAAYVAAEVADALDYAHRSEGDDRKPLHIVHRAVGPMRIRLGRNGRVQLTNFGAAYSELLGRIRSPDGLLRGDPAYIAPEILLGFLRPKPGQRDLLTPRNLTGRADIFSLGLVLLEMLVASYPLDPPDSLWRDVKRRFPGEVRSEVPTFIKLETLADRVLHFGPDEVQRVAEEVPPPLRQIVSKALRPNPDERYPSADKLRDELRAWLRGLPQPYGAKDAEEELAELLKEASDLDKLAVHAGVERGVLPVPPDVDTEEFH
ncbi:serine/threonine protein kinase [Archangium violaceum]|uniref:serine/threonine-protein kinase n=1 Tax=Archangium violaceum TaxID=83451 RepID=UPI00193C78AC|nr:serine/threonine-protein kinase [Archangium violaceum]QRK05220.1 serine/threonine protein kinase [Archangium violaceum]